MSEKALCGERVFPIPTRNTKRIEKKGKGGSKGTKGENCKTSPMKKFYLTVARARHLKDYEAVSKRFIARAND